MWIRFNRDCLPLLRIRTIRSKCIWVTMSPPKFRWKIGLAIIVLGCVIQMAAWLALEPNRTWQAFSLWGIVPLTTIVTLVWWTFLSGLSWTRRVLGLSCFGLAIAVGSCLLRVDGYSGEMLPLVAFRWQETSRQRAERYWATRPHLPERPANPATSVSAKPLLAKATEPKKTLLSKNSAATDDWAEFRGPKRDGVAHAMLRAGDLPPPLVWKHPVGAGWSSFAVSGKNIYTQEQRGENEAVVCYEFETGREIWSYEYTAHFAADPAGEGPRATPTVNQGRVYTLGATGILSCVVIETGRLLWSHDILVENGAKNLEWGLAASPLVYDDFVVVNPGGADGNGVVAYHRVTGEKLWSAGSGRASYASPQLATLYGTRVILVFDGVGLGGYDAATGTELWDKFKWTNSPQINVAQPIVLDEARVFISSGYGTGSALLNIQKNRDRWTATSIWTSRDLKLKFNDAVTRNGFVYGLDEGILVCLDLATGARRWKQGRYGFGQILLAGDTLLVQSEAGEVVLLEATPEGHHELGRFQGLEGVSWNCPVLCRGRLLLRNKADAACYDMKTSKLN